MSTKSTKVKCYHCGGVIENETTDLVLKKIPLSTKRGKRMYTRKFHMDCVSDFVGNLEVEKETQEENSDWEECYDYFKELLGIPEGMNLDQHAVLRTLGLRTGSYVPNGSNVRGIKRGYSFKTILMTMKFSSGAIKKAFGTMSFQNQKHKIDYAMKIITNNINFVHGKVEAKDRADRQLEVYRDDVSVSAVAEYKPKSRGGSSVTNLIDEAVGDDEMDELMSMFD